MAGTPSEKEHQQSNTGPPKAGELYQKYLLIHAKRDKSRNGTE